jgi:hypothetical protein
MYCISAGTKLLTFLIPGSLLYFTEILEFYKNHYEGSDISGSNGIDYEGRCSLG